MYIGLSFSGVSFTRQSVFFKDSICVAQISDDVLRANRPFYVAPFV